jgi:hypothetical protein
MEKVPSDEKCNEIMATLISMEKKCMNKKFDVWLERNKQIKYGETKNVVKIFI